MTRCAATVQIQRGSGSIEQDADVAITVCRAEYYLEKRQLKIRLLLNTQSGSQK